VAEDFVPDADLSEREWKGAERAAFDHDWTGRRHFPDSLVQVASLWSAQYIYFAFWCNYTRLNVYEGEDTTKERWRLWERDVVEVFINPQPDRWKHYYEFEVAPNNQWLDLEIDLDRTPFNDAAWDSAFEHATRIDAASRIWTCEMRIPLKSLSVERIESDARWRGNFYRAEGREDSSERRLLAWSPTLGERANFHKPGRFGVIRFVK